MPMLKWREAMACCMIFLENTVKKFPAWMEPEPGTEQSWDHAILSTHTVLLSCNMQFNIAPHYLQLLPNSLFSCILPNEILYTVFTPAPIHATHPSQVILFWFNQTNLITWREQIMNFIIMSLSPKSHCFLQTLYFGSTLCILIYYYF